MILAEHAKAINKRLSIGRVRLSATVLRTVAANQVAKSRRAGGSALATYARDCNRSCEAHGESARVHTRDRRREPRDARLRAIESELSLIHDGGREDLLQAEHGVL